MKVLAVTIFWIIAAHLLGWVEARYEYYQWTSPKNDKYNAHFLFILVRAMILIPLAYIIFTGNYWLLGFNVSCLLLLFVMCHDGAYYVKRNQLDGAYPKGYFAQSTTSTSLMDQKHLTDPITRVFAFVVGMAGLILLNY